MTDELVAVFREVPEVLPYIDIPSSTAIRASCARCAARGSAEEYLELFERLRREIPGMVIRSTALVGFPTETDEEFEELLGFMDRAGFDYTSVFAYSREDGTAAARMEGQVPERRSSSSAPRRRRISPSRSVRRDGGACGRDGRGHRRRR